MASVSTYGFRRVPRQAAWDALFVALSGAHAAVLVAAPSIPAIALLLWWNANTIAHNFIHRPFFASTAANRAFSAWLSLLLAVPQSLWRARHLRHHAGASGRIRLTRAMAAESALVAGLWIALASLSPAFLLTVFLPGWLAGLALCWLQGHYEHARGTTSHYGRLYNFLFFNDGYHVEHHARPGAHWLDLRAAGRVDRAASRWPPVLRWLETLSLEGLERLVLRSRSLQRFVLRVHERAFRRLMTRVGPVRRAVVVGGGLFPRTAIVLRRVLPAAAIHVVDAEPRHLASAAPFLPAGVTVEHAAFDPDSAVDADLVVIPLAFVGRRRDVYDRPPARAVLVHDWLWARRGAGVAVSWLLAKRLNLVLR